MATMLPEEENNAVRMKQKLMNDGPVKEETKSFLNFSRENLIISHSDLEQGFNRSRLRPSRNTILSVAALMIAVLCLGLESWKLFAIESCARCSLIEQLKRDVDSLKHRFLEHDLIHEWKAFEEQLYPEDSTEDSDPGEEDINNADYDSNYEDNDSTSHDYSSDYQTSLTYGSRSSDFLGSTSTTPGPNKTIVELSSTSHRTEAKRGQELDEKNVRESHKNIEHLNEEHEDGLSHERRISDANRAKYKRDIIARDVAEYVKESTKSKRSVSNHAMTDDPLMNTSKYQHDHKKTIVSRARSYASDKNNTNDNFETDSTTSTYHPKKYHVLARQETFPPAQDEQLGEEIIRSNRHTSESTETVGGGRGNLRNAHRDHAGNSTEVRRSVQSLEVAAREFHRRLTRRHLRASRQVYAIHYGADSTLFSSADEHTGNGRARHNNGVFKAWRPSDWVADLGMNRHFTLAADGKLTVHESGLYLVYAQIHYLDEHDENGFHILLNGRPILQCMVYSPGIEHKSRSCFSAQVTLLHADDHLVLKDVGSARYTLFQHDKSFFGLIKLGELRQQNSSRQKHTNN